MPTDSYSSAARRKSRPWTNHAAASAGRSPLNAASPRSIAARTVSPGLVEGRRRALLVLGPQEQLGRLRRLPQLQQRLRALAVEAALAVHDDRSRDVARLLVEPARLQRALLVRRGGRARRVGRRVRDVLGEVLLVGLGGLQQLAVLLPGLRRAQRVAALLVQLRRRRPLARLPEQPRRLEVVALLEEERGGLGRLARGGEQGGALLEVARLQVQLGGALATPELLVARGGGPVLLPLEVRLGGLAPAGRRPPAACRPPGSSRPCADAPARA